MRTRNRIAAVVVGILGAVETSFANPPLNSAEPTDVTAAPAAPALPEASDTEKKRKAAAIAARKAAKARIARCRVHPEVCRQ